MTQVKGKKARKIIAKHYKKAAKADDKRARALRKAQDALGAPHFMANVPGAVLWDKNPCSEIALPAMQFRPLWQDQTIKDTPPDLQPNDVLTSFTFVEASGSELNYAGTRKSVGTMRKAGDTLLPHEFPPCGFVVSKAALTFKDSPFKSYYWPHEMRWDMAEWMYGHDVCQIIKHVDSPTGIPTLILKAHTGVAAFDSVYPEWRFCVDSYDLSAHPFEIKWTSNDGSDSIMTIADKIRARVESILEDRRNDQRRANGPESGKDAA